ncbi:hypothetical protein H0H92_013415 [Tricholoma furcatifolium]|nr:hypothetical protein H0H92_013415 [Tricholoma furcatifolium]
MASVAQSGTRAIAVYCGSSIGKQQAHSNAALSVGRALAAQNRPLVYGGGMAGLMGVVSQAVLGGGGEATGVIPHAILAGGGERDKSTGAQASRVVLGESEAPKMQTIVVDSMHERKVEMASRSGAFIGLPAVVLLNVLSFYDPLRQLLENGIKEGYINPANRKLILFVDGPADASQHEEYDWGTAALDAIDNWEGGNLNPNRLFDWTSRKDGSTSGPLGSA